MPDQSLATVTESGDRRKSLEALRQTLAKAIDADPPARDLASLSRRLMMVMAELAALPEARKESVVDDITARREARKRAAG